MWASAHVLWTLDQLWAVFCTELVEVQLLATLVQRKRALPGVSSRLEPRPLPDHSGVRQPPRGTYHQHTNLGHQISNWTQLEHGSQTSPLALCLLGLRSTLQRSRPGPSTARITGRPDLRPPRKTKSPPRPQPRYPLRKDEPLRASCHQFNDYYRMVSTYSKTETDVENHESIL